MAAAAGEGHGAGCVLDGEEGDDVAQQAVGEKADAVVILLALHSRFVVRHRDWGVTQQGEQIKFCLGSIVVDVVSTFNNSDWNTYPFRPPLHNILGTDSSYRSRKTQSQLHVLEIDVGGDVELEKPIT